MDCFDGVLFPVELCLFLKGMELQQVATGVLGGVPLGEGVGGEQRSANQGEAYPFYCQVSLNPRGSRRRPSSYPKGP